MTSHSKHYAGFDADIANQGKARQHAAQVVEDWLKKKEQDYASGFAAGRKAALVECRDAIKKYINPGDLKGDGLDAHAQRNGMILAVNILDEIAKDLPR